MIPKSVCHKCIIFNIDFDWWVTISLETCVFFWYFFDWEWARGVKDVPCHLFPIKPIKYQGVSHLPPTTKISVTNDKNGWLWINDRFVTNKKSLESFSDFLVMQKCGTQSFARRDTSDEQFVAFHTEKTLLISAMFVHSGRTRIIWLLKIICFLLH